MYTPHFRDEDTKRQMLKYHHKNMQFILGKIRPGFGGRDKGREDVQSIFRNVQENNGTVWWKPRQYRFCNAIT